MWFGVTWVSMQYWWVFLVGAALASAYLYYQVAVRTVIHTLAGNWQSILILNFSSSKQYIKTGFFIMGLIALCIAVLRPQWSKKEQLIAQKGRDILIALDISKSMLAQDCEPNRLERAKKKIRRLLQMLDSERIGLLLFSGSAMVQCPLTNDYGAFHMFLDHVDVETISSGSTALDSAVKEGLRLFTHTPQGKHKLIVFFTDGEDFSSHLAQVKQEAQKEEIRIFTVGMGTPEGAPIPLYNDNNIQSGHQKDRTGKVVISQRNDEILSSLAKDMGGIYVPMADNGTDLHQLVSQVQRIEKGQFADKKMNQMEDQYHWFLLVGLLLLAIEWIL